MEGGVHYNEWHKALKKTNRVYVVFAFIRYVCVCYIAGWNDIFIKKILGQVIVF
jgi:hypothetical protein